MAESTVPAKSETMTPATREEERYLIPPVDIYETQDGLVVVADLPGVSKDNVKVRVEDDILTIEGQAAYERRGDALLDEFALRSYFRQFRLGDEVDQNRISADLKHGVLRLTLPKAERAMPRQIAVNYN